MYFFKVNDFNEMGIKQTIFRGRVSGGESNAKR